MTSEQYSSQQMSGATSTSAGGPSNLMFLIAGGVIGAAAALLFAPKPGSELRHDIADVTKRGYDGALDLTTRVKDETSHFYQRLVEKGSDLMGSAPQPVKDTTTSLANPAAATAEQAADDVLSLNEAPESNGPERNPSNSF